MENYEMENHEAEAQYFLSQFEAISKVWDAVTKQKPEVLLHLSFSDFIAIMFVSSEMDAVIETIEIEAYKTRGYLLDEWRALAIELKKAR